MAGTRNTIKASIARLLDKKLSELEAPRGPQLFNAWRAYLAEEGYSLERYNRPDVPTGKHIVLYSGRDGTVKAVVSTDDMAHQVRSLARWKIRPLKAGEREEA